MRFLVLGAGRMGFAAAYDLVNSGASEVVICDVDQQRAEQAAKRIGPAVKAVTANVSDRNQAVELMRDTDAVISCVVYSHNRELAEAAIEAKTNFCDLGGNNDIVAAELALDGAAREAGINIVPDCGLAPGMVSVLAAHGADRFDKLNSIRIMVGGLPQKPKEPLNYQIVFSVEGLINEYVEKARVIRDGRITLVESMTEVEKIKFKAPYGKLEAFQTSGGTSTLPETFLGRIDKLEYKTIRYPGHCEKMKVMIDLGLASSEPIVVDGVAIAPRRVLGDLLLRNLPSDEPDVVLVRLDFQGLMDGTLSELRYEIIDLFDEEKGLSAMMRTTAFPASIIAQMMARGEIKEKGAIPQERCVPTHAFMTELKKRKIIVNETGPDAYE